MLTVASRGWDQPNDTWAMTLDLAETFRRVDGPKARPLATAPANADAAIMKRWLLALEQNLNVPKSTLTDSSLPVAGNVVRSIVELPRAAQA